jgi:hypothetical protein
MGIAENYTQIAEVMIAQEKFRAAIPYVKHSVPLALKKEYRFLVQHNYKLLSEVYKKLRNTDSALYYYEHYVTYKDSILNVDVEQKIAALNVEFETEKKENEILRQRSQLAEKDLEVRRKNTLLFGGFGLALLLGLFGYLVYSQQRLKHRQLQKKVS